VIDFTAIKSTIKEEKMKLFIILTLFVTTILADKTVSTAKIPKDECLKYPYRHTIGGTMHSRMVQKKRLYALAQKEANYTKEEAFKEIAKRYGLDIKELSLKVKSCFVYFKVLDEKEIYYFDAKNLNLIQKKEI
jgi:hypothetical protein